MYHIGVLGCIPRDLMKKIDFGLQTIKHVTRGEPIKIQLYTIEKEANRTMAYWGRKTVTEQSI